MEYKKQFRWFAFLIIPFIVLLILHFMIPLQIIVNSFPLAQLKYNTQKIQDQQTTIRSILFQNANSMSTTIDYYDQISLRIRYFLQKENNKFYSASAKTAFANAFLINKGSKIPVNESMWYNGKSNNYQSLSNDLKKVYQSYLNLQLYLRHYFTQKSIQALQKVQVQCITKQNNDIIFAYPATKQSKFSEFNVNVTSNLNRIINSNKSQLLILTNTSIIRQSLINNSLFQCSVSVYLYQNKLIKQLQNAILSLQPVTSFSNRFIFFFPTNPNPIYNQFITYSVYNSTSNQLSNFTQILPSLINKAAVVHFSQLFINKTHLKSIHVDPQLGLPQYCSYVAIININNNQISVNNELDPKKLIIPIVILIIISSIISAFILKKLLDSIQLQLFQLGKCCSFIVQGDINIQIPNYQGTKDIKQVYQQVKIINKLHRYSTDTYFLVHFSQKILRYHEAIQFFKKIGYDISNALQNIGQACVQVQNWQIAIPSLISSIQIVLQKIQKQYGNMEQIIKLKQSKKVPQGYKQLQIILRRRIFKLNLAFLRYFDLRGVHVQQAQFLNNTQSLKKKQQYYIQCNTRYIEILKKAFYPQAASFSQSIIAHFNQAKAYATNKKSKQAQELIDKANKLLDQYAKEYNSITLKLKEKGSKNKFFYKKHKLTAHSRATPSVLSLMRDLWKSKVCLMNNKKPQRYLVAIDYLINGCKCPIVTIGIYYTLLFDIRKIATELSINLTNFQSTQIFRQVVPFKSLYYGPITKQIEPQLLKVTLKTSPGLERQYILIYDCSKQINKHKQSEYYDEVNNYIMNKLIKSTDRVSISRANLKNGNQVVNSLVLKQQNQIYLRKQMKQSLNIKEHYKTYKNTMFQQIANSVERIKKLRSQKIIMVFFHPLNHYISQTQNLNKKRNKSYNSENLSELKQDFGQLIIQTMRTQGLRNCKLILMLSEGDQRQSFLQYFGLWDINRRIWQSTNNINTFNNIVYIIEQKHKTDLDRILMIKIQDNANNHVFML